MKSGQRITEIWTRDPRLAYQSARPLYHRLLSLALVQISLFSWYLSLPSFDTYALYISLGNHAKSALQLAKNSFINRKCKNLSSSNSSRNFWHLTKIISNNLSFSSSPPLLHSDRLPAVFSVSKAEIFTQTYADDSTVDDYGLVPPSSPHSDFMPNIQILLMMFPIPSLALALGRYMGLMESLLLFPRTVLPCLHLAFPSLPLNFHLSFLLEVCLHTTCSKEEWPLQSLKLPCYCFDFLSFQSLWVNPAPAQGVPGHWIKRLFEIGIGCEHPLSKLTLAFHQYAKR